MTSDKKQNRAVENENRKIKQLRFCADLTYAVIAQGALTPDEAYIMIESLKKVALTLFPGKEKTFDLIYLPRFKRLLVEKFQMH